MDASEDVFTSPSRGYKLQDSENKRGKRKQGDQNKYDPMGTAHESFSRFHHD